MIRSYSTRVVSGDTPQWDRIMHSTGRRISQIRDKTKKGTENTRKNNSFGMDSSLILNLSGAMS
jgi:hypothetical protein